MMSLIVSAQQSLKFDSSRFENNIEWNYYSTKQGQVLRFARGGVVFPPTGACVSCITKDSNLNVIIGVNNAVDGMNNFIGLNNGLVNGHENFSCARNIIIKDGVVGTGSFGADHTFLKGADYGFAANDAHTIGAESASAFGFGNKSFNYYGFVTGNGNTLGIYPASFTGGFLAGQRINAPNEVYGMGRNFTMTSAGIVLGWNGTQFKILSDGSVWINGLKWPTTQPQQGDVLGFGGGSQLIWVSQTTAQKTTGFVTPEGRIFFKTKQ